MVGQAESSAVEIGDWLEARKSELTMLASVPAVVSGNAEVIIPILAAAKNTNEAYDDLVYADQNGDSVNENGFKVNVADRPYFKPAMAGQAFISNPVLSKASGHLVTVIAVPVKAGDKVVGVLFGPTNLIYLLKECLRLR